MKLLTSIPGIKDITAMGIICELGDDLSQFTSIRRFCKWIGLAPDNNESAGKKYSGRTTPGNKYLKALLVEAASGIGLMKNDFLHEVHQRFKERRGTKKVNVALAHKMCRIIFSVLTHGTAYQEQYKPVLKEHRFCKAVQAVAGLREVGYICDDIEIQDSSNGYVMKIFGANKRKRAKTLQTQLFYNCLSLNDFFRLSKEGRFFICLIGSESLFGFHKNAELF